MRGDPDLPDPRDPRRRGETGIGAAAGVLLAGAFANCALGYGLAGGPWLPPIAGPSFFLLGLELAGMALVVSGVALGLGPRLDGPGEPRRAWITATLALALAVGGATWVLPRVAERAGIG